MTAMKEKSKAWQRLEAQHRRLAQELGRTGFISQGSVFARKKGGSGSRYQWSWKDPRQKTRSLTLSREQFAWLQASETFAHGARKAAPHEARPLE